MSPTMMNYCDYLEKESTDRGHIYLDSHIEFDTINIALQKLDEAIRKENKEITLHIMSEGGEVYPSFALFDRLVFLSKSGVKIICLVEGLAASAAAMIILQGGDERLATPNSRFLLHEASRFSFLAREKTSDMKDETREMEAITKKIVAILAIKCHKTELEVIQTIERKEVWMSAQEAKEWGLIDRII